MKKILLSMCLALVAMAASAQASRDYDYSQLVDTVYTVHSIDQAGFKDVIADWNARDWVLKSERPVVVDFYADWCRPCRRLEPILRDIAHHYQGAVDFYRINVEKNPEIAAVFQVRSIPYLLICPMQGEPKEVIGLYPEQEYIRVINLALGRH